MKKREVTVDLLMKMLSYDGKTGKLYWKPRDASLFSDPIVMPVWNSNFAGKETFRQIGKNGYRYGRIYRKKYYTHRVAWALFYGEWPENQVDHINGNPLDNRIENLRSVTNSENQRNASISSNNKSGIVGVYFNKKRRKWHARIGVDGGSVDLGYFSDWNDAKAARAQAEVTYSYHENHGRGSQRDCG